MASIKEHNNDPDAYPKLSGRVVREHNEDAAAHPAMSAHVRSVELALNGSETLTGAEDPTRETAGERDQRYINLTTGAEFVCTAVEEDGCVWTKQEGKTSLRKALEQAQKTATEAASAAAAAKEVADGAAQAIAAVQNTVSVVPSQSGSLTYNRGAQTPSWNNVSTEMLEVTYGEDRTPAAEFKGETNAGNLSGLLHPEGRLHLGRQEQGAQGGALEHPKGCDLHHAKRGRAAGLYGAGAVAGMEEPG